MRSAVSNSLVDRSPLTSSVLRSAGYDPALRVLELEFDSGTVYRYFDVPDDLFCALMAAASHGEYFASHIRDAGFDYMQVD